VECRFFKDKKVEGIIWEDEWISGRRREARQDDGRVNMTKILMYLYENVMKKVIILGN
jgi:hypothetical protein